MTKSSNGIKTISPGGELIDIKIKINNLAEADPVIVRHWKTLVKDIKLRQKEIQKYTPEQAKYLDNSDLTVLRTSRHKFKNNEFEGALIEFYLRVPKNLQMGDKISSRFGAKGVITKIIEKDKIPSASFTGNIDIFLSPSGVIGRRNTAILKELYLGKILYFMKDVFAEMSKKGDMEKVKKLMLKVYNILDVTKDKSIVKSVEEYLKNTNDKKLQSLLVAKELNINYIIPPFNTMEFDKIQEAANLLDIPLNEKVYIPELDMWTKTEVPVGIQYVTRHEQLSDDYASTRSVGKYTQFGQATKGKSNQGGQSLGNLDVYAILTYDVPDLLKELMVSRSDNMKSKIKLISSIREKGSYRLEKTDIENSTTNVIKNILMKGIGLKMM
jgi:DNA-directed RNA polymerase beta subunit